MKLFILVILLFISTALESKTIKHKHKHKDTLLCKLRSDLAIETKNYYKNHSVKRNEFAFRPYLYSSLRVARMFPIFPAKNEQDRMIKFFAFGARESGYKKNFASVNVPGSYQNGKVRIRKFSIDYGWTGINSSNADWVYEVARCIQLKRPVPKYLNLGTDCINYLKCCEIPTDIKLVHIDLQTYKDARKIWISELRKGTNYTKIRSLINVPFHESNLDEIDSMLIYRVIIELDRHCHGWSYNNYHLDLYRYLSQFIG